MIELTVTIEDATAAKEKHLKDALERWCQEMSSPSRITISATATTIPLTLEIAARRAVAQPQSLRRMGELGRVLGGEYVCVTPEELQDL